MQPSAASDRGWAAKPLKVFILAGQSDMQGHVNVSTFDSMSGDPKTAPILKEMRGADGKPIVCDRVRMASIGCAGDDTMEQSGKLTTGFGASSEAIGPEFTFGIYMEKALNEPILIIKTSWVAGICTRRFVRPGQGLMCGAISNWLAATDAVMAWKRKERTRSPPPASITGS